MVKVIDVVNRCDTGLVRELSMQIIDELNLLVPNALVSISDLFVDVEGSQINPFLQPKAKQALALAIKARGTKLIINSAYRTVAQQFLIRRQFEAGLCHITAAAQPGCSNHEGGLALDVEGADGWQPFLQAQGWKRLGRDYDFPHYDYSLLAGIRQDLKRLGVKSFQSLWNKHNPGDLITVDGSFGPNTAARLGKSPANGFGMPAVVILRRNDRGKEVLALQQALGLTGDTADGVFGPQTEEALKKFQAVKGLSPDGVAGPSTLAALGLRFNIEDETPAADKSPIQFETTEEIDTLENLITKKAVITLSSLYANSKLATEIQSRLSAIGLLQVTDVNGLYGPITEAAIGKFCTAHFLDNVTTG